MPAVSAWSAGLEGLLNRWIDESAQAASLAHRLDGTSLDVDVDGVGGARVSLSQGRLNLLTRRPSADPGARLGTDADASIRGTPTALLQLLRGGGAARGTRNPVVQISGNAETANAYRELFILARPDLEEELARWLGDLPARRLSRLAAGARDWLGNSRRTAAANVAEYLEEESRDLVNRTELEEFLEGVDSLREGADRVAARLTRLEQRLKGMA